MNALCYKIVFSKRLGTLVAVGEHTSGQGKAASGTGTRCIATNHGVAVALKTSTLAIALSWLAHSAYAASPVTTALPTGASINSGNVAISTQGAAMTIQQSSAKASVNWNSFNIGSAASVNINQPNANAVLLNRVTGNDPSQIFGKLSANGQVVLINPNGVVFGQGGSVTASAFTASTFGLSDDDFAKGKYNYTRNGSTAGVTVQNGSSLNATATGGYVALIGASVNNEGTISTKQGSVVIAAGDSAVLPTALTDNVSVPLSGKVRLELSPSTINASVANSGAITTEGGQVLMQAAAISDAVASISHTGSINTTGAQGGAVTLQADGGIIQAHSSIKANSTDANRVGGDIIIGRDTDTGVLARATDVSGAKLESQGGFVETSGMQLAVEGIQVKAKDWLLDPVDIEINAGTGTQAGYSQITNTTIDNALNAGTAVTIQTTGSGSTSLTPNPTWSGTGGRILVSGALSKTNNNTTAKLTLTADTQIDVNNRISNTAGTLAVVLNAPTVNSSISGSISGVNLTVNNTVSGAMAGVISNSTPISSLTKNGTGSISLTGANTYTGNTAVNSGTVQVTNMASFLSANVNIASGAVFEANATSNSRPTSTSGSGVTFRGDGTFRKTGSGAFNLRNDRFGMFFALSSNALVDLQEGALQVDGSTAVDTLFGSNNFSVLNINSGAVFDILSQKVFFRGITGSGTIFNSYSRSAPPTFDTLVVGNGVTDSKVSYDFSGVIGGPISNINILQANYDKRTSSYIINLNKLGVGTQILSYNNRYSGTTRIDGGTLQIGNGGTSGTLGTGAVTIANNTHLKFLRSSNTIITNTITGEGTGDVYANIQSDSGASPDLAITNNISLATGTVTLNADGNVSLPSLISTNNTSNSAVVINAGQALNAGDSSGGNVLAKADTKITVGQGGRATLYTGSIAGSSNVTTLIGSGTGRFRYGSDETTNSYNTSTAALGTGLYAIYREAPMIEFTANSVSGLIYNGLSQTGTQAVTQTAGALKNGDSSFMLTGTNSYSYTQNGAATEPRNAGSYTITAYGQVSDLGYLISYKSGTLSISKKDASITGVTTNVTYDSTTQTQTPAVLDGFIAADVSNGTVSATGLASGRNAGTYASNLSATGADAGNYNVTVTNKDLVIAKKNASITGVTTNVTYDSTTQTQTPAVLDGFIAADVSNGTVSATGLASGRNAGTYASNLSATGADAGNYNVTVANKDLVIAKKVITLSGIAVADKTYDGTTSASITNTAFSGLVGSESLGTSATSSFDSKNAGARIATVSTDNITLSDNASSGGLVSNYKLVSGSKTASATITKAQLTLMASADSKTYDGTTSSNAAVQMSGLVVGDSANATQAFVNKNALGTNGSTLQVNSGYVVNDGNSGNNYIVKLTDAKGTIAPRSLTPTYAEPSKKMDGNTLATVEASPSTFGVLGSDDVTITQSATYDTPTAGTGKTVTVRNIALSGKDSGNYSLKSSSTTVKGTIVAVPPIVVPPVVTPTQALSNSGKSGGGGANARIAIGDANPFQLANVPSAIEEVCSSTNLEKCHCVESPMDKDVSICYEPK